MTRYAMPLRSFGRGVLGALTPSLGQRSIYVTEMINENRQPTHGVRTHALLPPALSVRPSIRPSVHLSIRLSVYLSSPTATSRKTTTIMNPDCRRSLRINRRYLLSASVCHPGTFHGVLSILLRRSVICTSEVRGKVRGVVSTPPWSLVTN